MTSEHWHSHTEVATGSRRGGSASPSACVGTVRLPITRSLTVAWCCGTSTRPAARRPSTDEAGAQLMAVPSYHAVVLRTHGLTPRLQRVTVGGPGLDGFASRGLPDERVKLLLPAPGQERPELPTVTERGFGFAPGVQRPTMRSFTLRRFDPESLELDIEIVAHEGHASSWARSVAPGARVGITGPAGGYDPGEDARRHLLLGDETALPAITTILERLPAGARADVLVEVADDSAEVALPGIDATHVTWLRRDGSAEPAGALLVSAVRALPWPEEPVHVWAAGETSAMRAIRRHLREEQAVPREQPRGHRPLARAAHVRRGECRPQRGAEGGARRRCRRRRARRPRPVGRRRDHGHMPSVIGSLAFDAQPAAGSSGRRAGRSATISSPTCGATAAAARACGRASLRRAVAARLQRPRRARDRGPAGHPRRLPGAPPAGAQPLTRGSSGPPQERGRRSAGRGL